MKRVAIFGVGLIGGSFALAIRKAGFTNEIIGVSSPKTIQAAVELGVIDRGVTQEEAVAEADFLYLAQPIRTIINTLGVIGPQIREGMLVTDAGSTKGLVLERARSSVRRGLFVGGHPMAGKELSGVLQAEASLFAGRPYVLSPVQPEDVAKPGFHELSQWVERIGARAIVLEAEQHDRTVAYVSHLPQLLSTALASLLSDVENAPAVAGPGVLELTRLALSPFDIWRDILGTNSEHVRAAIELLVAKLNEYGQFIASDALAAEFAKAGESARLLRKRS